MTHDDSSNVPHPNANPAPEALTDDSDDEGLDEYDKADADSFPASDPPVQP